LAWARAHLLLLVLVALPLLIAACNNISGGSGY
jgi:predicted small secreted protein